MKKKAAKVVSETPVVPTLPPPHRAEVTEKPHIFADRLAQLSPEERAQLRGILTDPLYLKLLRIVATQKPSAHCSLAGSTTRDAFSDARATARLGEMRGWELYEASMFLALNEPPKVNQAVKDNFPDEGRADAEWTHPRVAAHN